MANIVSLSSQTFVAYARYVSQSVTFNGVEHFPDMDGVVRVQGTGSVDLSPGWWDLVTIVDGEYAGPPFSGATASGELVQTQWIGEPNQSPSIYETRTVTGNPTRVREVIRGPWIGGQGHSGARFSGTPTYISNSPYGGGRVGFAATFVEVGDSLYG